MKTYAEAEAYLAGGRDPRRRRLPGRATEVHRIGDSIHVMYHATDVVTYYPNRVVLNSGGYRTQTTKERMNKYSPATIFQRNGLWYVGKYGEPGTLFYDRMVVCNSGRPVNPAPVAAATRLEAAKRKVDRLVPRYIVGFVTHLRELGYLPSGLPNYRLDADTLLMCLEQRRYVVSLLHSAINEQGYSNPEFIVQLINSDLRRGLCNSSDFYHVKSSLRAYFKSRKLALAELIVTREGA